MSELKAYFKDIYDKKPFCYERIIGKIKLPWNDEVLDIFICAGPITVYIPVVDGLYDDAIWFGEDKYNGFTEEDLNKYVERIKNKKRQDEIDQQERIKSLEEATQMLKAVAPKEVLDKIHFMEAGWYIIFSETYELRYVAKMHHYAISKYKIEQPYEKRFYWWNVDKSFESITAEDTATAINKFIELVAKE